VRVCVCLGGGRGQRYIYKGCHPQNKNVIMNETQHFFAFLLNFIKKKVAPTIEIRTKEYEEKTNNDE